MWAIWRIRNDQIFRQISRATNEALTASIREGHQQHSRFIANDTPKMNPPPAPNIGSPPGFLMINIGQREIGNPDITIQIDGSWDATTGCGGMSWVIIQSTGHHQRHGSFLYASSALQTEAKACLAAIRWARTSNLSQILILTDSALLVKYLGYRSTVDITLLHTLNDIREAGSNLQWCRLLKVHRDQVKLAHMTANSYRYNRFVSF